MPRPSLDGVENRASWFRAAFHTEPVGTLRLSQASEDGRVVSAETMCSDPLEHGTLWVTYRDRVVIGVKAAEVKPSGKNTAAADRENGKKKRLPAHTKCTLEPFSPGSMLHYGPGEPPLFDCAVCAPPRPSLLSPFPAESFTLLACGAPPYPMAFYTLGDASAQSRSLRHIARQAARALRVSAVKFISGLFGDAGEQASPNNILPPIAKVPLAVAGGVRDDRRTASRAILDPTLRYALSPDQLGRVLLVDTTRQIVLRVWKGVRDAECGWIQESPESEASRSLRLHICLYSPRRGFVDIFQALHGPKVRTISVGINARLLTAPLLPSSSYFGNPIRGARSACFILLAPRTNGAGGEESQRLELLKIAEVLPVGDGRDSDGSDQLKAQVSAKLDGIPPSCCLAKAFEREITTDKGQGDYGEEESEWSRSDDRMKAIEADVACLKALQAIISEPPTETADSKAFSVIRRLRTAAGVQDASLLMLQLPVLLVQSPTKEEALSASAFVRDVLEWSLDAEKSGILLPTELQSTAQATLPQANKLEIVGETKEGELGAQQVLIDKDYSAQSCGLFGNTPPISEVQEPQATTSLACFLSRRQRLLRTYGQLGQLMEDLNSTSDAACGENSQSPEVWLTERWRAEAIEWSLEPLGTTDDIQAKQEWVPVGAYLHALEVDCALIAERRSFTDRILAVADALFRPMLIDVFSVSSVAKMLRVLGPILGGNGAEVPESDVEHQQSEMVASQTLSSSRMYVLKESSANVLPSEASSWAPRVGLLFGTWLMTKSPTLLRAGVLTRSSSSCGAVRFLEALCATSSALGVETCDGIELPIFEKILSPIFTICRESQSNIASTFAVATVAQEAFCRAMKTAECRTYGLASSAGGVGLRSWSTLLCQLR